MLGIVLGESDGCDEGLTVGDVDTLGVDVGDSVGVLEGD